MVKNVSIDIPRNSVIAVMGPSGCGKTTFLRGINRMHELIPGAHADGKIWLNDEDVMEMHPIVVRLKIGMVFQRPNPFPNLSIHDNVLAGYKFNGIKLSKSEKRKDCRRVTYEGRTLERGEGFADEERYFPLRRTTATSLYCQSSRHAA